MQTWTFFVQSNVSPGFFIQAASANTLEAATEIVLADAAEAWRLTPSDMFVRGVAKGEVEILEWEDN